MHKSCFLQLSWITGSNQFRSQNVKEIHWIYKYWDISFFEMNDYDEIFHFICEIFNAYFL